MIRIVLTDWMCHRHLDLTIPTAIGFLVGGNRRGKTAVRDAAEFCFLGTGLLRGIDTKKALAALSIRDGAKSCSVAIETPRVRLCRTMKADASQRLSRATRVGPDAKWGAEEPIALADQDSLFRAAADVVRCVLEPTAFYRLEPTRRREILIQATTEVAHEDEIAKALLELVAETMGPLPSAERAAEVNAAGKAMAKRAAEHGFRAAEDHAIDQRRQAKRDLEAVVLPEPVGTFDGIDLTKHTLEQHEAKLEALRAARQAAITAKSHDLGQLEGQLAEAERAHRAFLESVEVGEPDAGAAKALADAKAALVAPEARLATMETEISAARAAAGAEEWKRPGQCPAVPEAVDFPCPVKEPVFAKAMAKAGEARRSAQARLDELETERNALLATLAPLREACDAAQARVTAEEARAQRVADADAEADRLEQRIRDLSADLEAKREAAAKADDADALGKRIELGENVVRAKRKHDEDVRALEAARQAQERHQAAIALWDALAKALAPEGVETRLGGTARSSFEERLAQLEHLTGKLALDAEFALWVVQGAERRHHVQLSESHRLAVGIAVQHALASLVGFPFLMCDALDTLDAQYRRLWLQAAQEIAPGYPAGVLGLATTTTEPPGPPPEGVTTAWLKPDGAVVVLGAEGF